MKIAFTSCSRFEAFETQQEWEQILNIAPDYLFLLGDNIYMDYGIAPFSDEPVGCPKEYSSVEFERIMRSKYDNQFNSVPAFQALVSKMRSKNGFYAIWDDHDFAWDNAKGDSVPDDKKDISRELFHEYLDCSTNLPHTYYHIDTPMARVIFIDNRTDAQDEGLTSRLLSDEQFSFIESKIHHDMKYTILCGGLSLTEGNENWCSYPSQLKRLCKITEGIDDLFFLCGDIHSNRFVKPKYLDNIDATTPVQLVSSGMQVNYFGLGISWDDQHNWAVLDLGNDAVKVSFYNKKGLQKRMSNKATKFINKRMKERY